MYMHSHSVATPACRTPQSRQQAPDSQQASGLVRLEISTDKLRELVNVGALCATDVRCLDCESKQCVWRICLHACIKHFSARPLPG